MLQTFQPEHPVIRAILGGDEEAFWRAEAAEREAAGMPPYGRLAGIIISAGDAASAFETGPASGAQRRGDPCGGVASSTGPRPRRSPASGDGTASGCWSRPPKGAPIQGAITRWMSGLKLPSQVRLAVDIDPQSFY